MAQIDELKNIWQNQKMDSQQEINQEKMFSENMLDKLKKFEKKQDKRTNFKTFGIIAILTAYLIVLIVTEKITFFLAAGFIIIGLSAGIFMYLYRKTQFKIEKLNLFSETKELISSAVAVLEEQKELYKGKFRIFFTGLILGLNVLYLDLLKDLASTERILMHVGMTIILLITMYFGLKLRKRIFNRDFQPLIDELTEMNKDLGE